MLALAVHGNKWAKIDFWLRSTYDHSIGVSQLVFVQSLLYFLYSQVVSASLTLFLTPTQLNNIVMIAGSDLQKSKSQSWYLDSAFSQHLTSEKKMFVASWTESLTKIEWANVDYLTAHNVRKTKILCFKEDSSESSITINNVLYLPKARANLFFQGQLSERGVNIKTKDGKM